LTDGGIFSDDAMVVTLRARKEYVDLDGRPGCMVQVRAA